MSNWILIAVLISIVALAGIEAVQVSAIKAKVTGGFVADAGSGNLDTSGWTEDEIMNYEMHGIIPARASGSSGAQPAPSAMVGGC